MANIKYVLQAGGLLDDTALLWTKMLLYPLIFRIHTNHVHITLNTELELNKYFNYNTKYCENV